MSHFCNGRGGCGRAGPRRGARPLIQGDPAIRDEMIVALNNSRPTITSRPRTSAASRRATPTTPWTSSGPPRRRRSPSRPPAPPRRPRPPRAPRTGRARGRGSAARPRGRAASPPGPRRHARSRSPWPASSRAARAPTPSSAPASNLRRRPPRRPPRPRPPPPVSASAAPSVQAPIVTPALPAVSAEAADDRALGRAPVHRARAARIVVGQARRRLHRAPEALGRPEREGHPAR